MRTNLLRAQRMYRGLRGAVTYPCNGLAPACPAFLSSWDSRGSAVVLVIFHSFPLYMPSVTNVYSLTYLPGWIIESRFFGAVP